MTTLTTRSVWTERVFRGIIPLLVVVFITGFFVRESSATVVIYRVSEQSLGIANHQPLSGNKLVTRLRMRWKGYAVIDIDTLRVKMVYTEKTKDSKIFSIWDYVFFDSGALVGKHSLLRKHALIISTEITLGGQASEHVYETISGIHRPDRLPFPATLKRNFNVELAHVRSTVSTAMKGTWRLDRRLSADANAEDDESAEIEGTLARGLDEVRNVLESKDYVRTPNGVWPPEMRLRYYYSSTIGTVIDSTFYD